MNTKRLIIGSLVGLVSLYITGYLIWEVAFTEFSDANRGTATGVEREAQVIWSIALGTLFYGTARRRTGGPGNGGVDIISSV